MVPKSGLWFRRYGIELRVCFDFKLCYAVPYKCRRAEQRSDWDIDDGFKTAGRGVRHFLWGINGQDKKQDGASPPLDAVWADRGFCMFVFGILHS